MEPQATTISTVRAAVDAPVDDVLRALADSDARTVVAFVATRPEASLDRLAGVVVGASVAGENRIASPAEHDRTAVKLHHDTLPRLEDCGFLAYDPDERRVTDADVPEPVVAFLEVDRDDDAS